MWFTLFDSRYRKIWDYTNEAAKFANNKSFAKSLAVSSEALDYISAKCADVKNVDLSLAQSELFLIRAESTIQTNSIEDSLTKNVMTDFNAAIHLLEGSKKGRHRYHSACILAGQYLLQASAVSEIGHLDQAYALILQGNKALEEFTEAPIEEKYHAKAALAKCIGLNLPKNSHYDIDQAIALMTEVHLFFSSSNDQDNLVQFRHFLTDLHMRRFIEYGNHIDLDRAIQYYQEIILIVDPNDPMISDLVANLGRALLVRKQNFRKQDILAAYEILRFALSCFDKENDFEEWASVALDLIRSLILLNTYYPIIVDDMDVKKANLKIIREIFESLEKIDYPPTKYKALRQLETLKTWYPNENLPDQHDLVAVLAAELREEADWTDLYVELVLLQSHTKENSEATKLLEMTLSGIDKTKWGESYLDICMHLSICFINQNDNRKACPYLLESLEFIQNALRKIDRNNATKARRIVNLNDRDVIRIPFSLVEAGYLHAALKALEILRFHPVNSVLEELLVINKQIDRKYWFLQHKTTKQFELFMQSAPKGDELDSHKTDKFLQKMSEDNKKLKKAENYYKEVQQLVLKNHEYSENVFLENLPTRIKHSTYWILLPLCSSHDMRVILVPPAVLELDIFVLDIVPGGNSEVLKAFTKGEHHGWLGSVMNNSGETISIEANPNIPDFKKSALLQNLREARESSFQFMEEYLYDTIWMEALKEILANSPEDLRSVVVIAQGPYTALPLCLAKNPSTERYVLDDVDISYVPSLYSLYALTERLKETKYKQTVAFLTQEPNANDSTNLKSIPIENELIGTVFGSDSTYVGIIEPMSIAESCDNASYWHFSTHGTYFPHVFDGTFFDF